MQTSGDGNGGGVRATTTQGGDVAQGIDALEAGANRNVPALEGLDQPVGLNLGNLGLGVA